MDKESLINSLTKGYIDRENKADERLVPKLLVNDFTNNIKVLSYITEYLKICDEFIFVVAFANMGGLSLLTNTLEETNRKNIKGTIILSAYQKFTQPNVLKKLKEYRNIDLYLIKDESQMHSKGYIFRKDDMYSAIIGSSNITQGALTTNKEWNIKIDFTNSSSIIDELLSDFNKIKNEAEKASNEVINNYELLYEEYRSSREVVKDINQKVLSNTNIKPNSMQVEALSQIQLSREKGNNRALICSSTGTGKTILLALDVKKFNPKKFLFIVHREQICHATIEEFKKVLGNNIDAKIISSGKKEDAKYLFATVQTLSKEKILSQFNKDEFDYIAVDEVHKAGAKSYLKIIDYFKPKFLIGLSATPDRTDGFNIYELFNYNIPYEIRLKEALYNNLVCPFHYKGVSDIIVDGKIIDDKTDVRRLTSDDRIKYILEQSEKEGYSGTRLKGLIFVSRKEEAVEFANKINLLGKYKAACLTGEDKQEERERCIELLEEDAINKEHLDFIVTVDIFNEGIDIPSVNQVILARPTKSSIIFLQQLGRGLRKYKDKEYLTVIDIIGNYDANFMIPKALADDQTGNKDNLRRYLHDGLTLLPGGSIIEFDNISKDQILSAIDRVNTSDYQILKEEYKRLKNRLGRIPTLLDFKDKNVMDIMRIINKYGSYYNFLLKVDNDYKERFSSMESKYIEFLSSSYICGKRPHELLLLNILLSNKTNPIAVLQETMDKKYPNINFSNNTKVNLINQFTQNYAVGSNKAKYKECVLLENINSKYEISTSFKKLLERDRFKEYIEDIIELGLYRNNEFYFDTYKDTSLCLNKKYNYDDIFRLLDWSNPEVALNVGGYKYNKETNTLPIFINYRKDENISDTTKYEDRFNSSKSFTSISKQQRTLDSPDVQQIINAKRRKTSLLLFVRKDKDDKNSKEFYFLGNLDYEENSAKEITIKNTSSTAVEFNYLLEHEVDHNLYNYLTSSI